MKDLLWLSIQNEKITGVVTGIFDGKKLVSGLFVRPQFAIDKSVDVLKTAENLLEGLKEKGSENLEVAELFSWEPIREFEEIGFQTREYFGEQGTIILDLSKGADALFKDFSQTRRNELRKAIKQNKVQISEVENTDELRELYAIHCDWNERKGNKPDKFEDFEIAGNRKITAKFLLPNTTGKSSPEAIIDFVRAAWSNMRRTIR